MVISGINLFPNFSEFDLENLVLYKQPKKGKCKNSSFACGWHRIGTLPLYSVLDGGVPGDSCIDVCIDCGKSFKGGSFLLKNQPSIFYNGQTFKI